MMERYAMDVFSLTYRPGWQPPKVDGNAKAGPVLNAPSACASLRQMPPYTWLNAYHVHAAPLQVRSG